MATGTEHYLAAEHLTEQAGGVMNYEHGIYSSMNTGERLQNRAAFLAEAQVHATLALAAATALNDADGGLGAKDHEAWREAASANPPTEH